MSNIFNLLLTGRLLLQYRVKRYRKFKAVRRNSHRRQSVSHRATKLRNFCGAQQRHWPPKLPKCCNSQGWDPTSWAAFPQMWWRWENGPWTTAASFRLSGLEQNLIEVSLVLLLANVATGPRNDDGIQDVTAANLLVNFYPPPPIDESLKGLPGGENSSRKHHELWILAVLDDSRRVGRQAAPPPAVLMIVVLFEGK